MATSATKGAVVLASQVFTYVAVIPGIAYGIVITLSLNCFQYTWKTEYSYSRRTRPLMLVYIALMFAFATLAYIQVTITMIRDLVGLSTGNDLFHLYGSTPLSLPFTVWGADGLMIWRTASLYKGVSSGLARATILCILSLLSLAISAFVNVVLAFLIVSRLWYIQRRLRQINLLHPKQNSNYTRIITIVAYSVLHAIGTQGSNQFHEEVVLWSLIPFVLIPQICVISSLLIVYRVALGRSAAEQLHSNTIKSQDTQGPRSSRNLLNNRQGPVENNQDRNQGVILPLSLSTHSKN
ncbi:hypothetical protein BDZ97DRAFT_2057970, partial [Flammula alnicola]